MSPIYAPLPAGMLYTLPLLVWLLPGLEYADDPGTLHALLARGLGVLVLAQALAAIAFLPLASGRGSLKAMLSDLAVLLLVPLPLGVALVLGGGGGWPLLLGSQLALLLGAGVLGLAMGRLHGLPAPWGPLASPLAQLALLVLAALAAGPWLDWMTP